MTGAQETTRPRWRPGPVLVLWVFVLLVVAVPSSALRGDLGKQREAAVNLMVSEGYFVIDTIDERRQVVVNRKLEGFEGVLGLVEKLELREDMGRTDVWRGQSESRLGQIPVVGFVSDAAPPSLMSGGDTWRGEVVYANPTANSAIPLVHTGSDAILEFDAQANIPALNGKQAAPVIDVEQLGDVTMQAPVFQLACAGTRVALVYRVGDQLALRAEAGAPCSVTVSGRSLGNQAACADRGIPRDQCNFAPVRQGELVTVWAPGKTRTVAEFQRRRPLRDLMVMRRDASLDKIFEAPEFERIVTRLAKDIGGELLGCDKRRTGLLIDCDDDVELSIDQQIQQEVAAAIASAGGNGVKRKAAVVMNALTGEIVAMGGVFDNLGSHCAHPALCPLPIGSTGKPIFATAMIASDQRRDLATLEVPLRSAGFSQVLGLPLSSTRQNVNGRGVNGYVDLEGFVANSDNYYIAALALLASPQVDPATCPVPAEERFRIAGKLQSRRPQSAFEGPDCQPLAADFMIPDFRPAWAERLEAMFDLDVYSIDEFPSDGCKKDRLYGTSNRDAALLRGLLRPNEAGCLFEQSGAERHYLNINQQRDFSDETVVMLLGGGQGRMTTVKLAEAYARLVTGRRVAASLIWLDADSLDYGAFDRAGLQARTAVSKGMARVIEGTAAKTDMPAAVAELESWIAPDFRLGVFAKTGTIGLTPEFQSGCPARSCNGKAFVVTLALYRRTGPDESRRVMSAEGRAPVCAVTIAVNLAQLTASKANEAADVAAAILRGEVGRSLASGRGEFCAR